MSPDLPHENDDPDTSGKTVPPYDDRQKSGDVDGPEKSTKQGAETAGATGPVQDDAGMNHPDPADTPGGAEASPADEQPASESGGSAEDEGSVGPDHYAGTGRGEDKLDEEGT
ncbi:MAG TPA: hypothetical protein VFG63_12325 [Nocardioidaceae bacterium]|nr:hypothetical protein [Nocardioidaceae bacterium]